MRILDIIQKKRDGIELTKEEIDYTIESLVEIIGKLRELSPLWKTFKDNKLTNVASFD